MILTLSSPLWARWWAAVSRATFAMRTVDLLLPVGAAFIGVVASIVLVPDWRGILGAALAVLMVAIAAIDARRFIIPDELTAAALALGLAYAVVDDPDAWAQSLAWSMLRAAISALAFFGVRIFYRRLRGRDGIGLGDVKLAAVVGTWLDWSIIPIAVDIAAVTAIAAYLIRHFYFKRGIGPSTRMPFGLFLAPAIWIGWLIETTPLLFPSISSL
jgi:leader peptidase (prepilin peptidase) / N-methyltransferase